MSASSIGDGAIRHVNGRVDSVVFVFESHQQIPGIGRCTGSHGSLSVENVGLEVSWLVARFQASGQVIFQTLLRHRHPGEP